jgi:hypothetical protein
VQQALGMSRQQRLAKPKLWQAWTAYQRNLGRTVRPPSAGAGRPAGAAGGGGLPGSTGRFGGAAPGSLTPGGLAEYLKAGRTLAPIYDDPKLLEQTLGLGGFSGSLDEMLKQALLGSAFGAVDRWRVNLGGGTQTPGTESSSFALDMHELRRIIGGIQEDLTAGRTPRGASRQQFVPDWAPGVFDKLVGGGEGSAAGILSQLKERSARSSSLDFDMSYLSSPGINLTDPTKPLFAEGSHPASLWGGTGGQAGEESFMRTLSAQEYMEQILPIMRQAFHQEAGAPNPYGGAPMFGIQGGSPMTQTDAYKRWTAYGQPSSGEKYRGVESGAYNPFTGGYQYSPMGGGQPGIGMLMDRIMSGEVRPEHFFPFQPTWAPQQDWLADILGRGTTAGFLQDPSVWFAGPYAPYAPGQLSPDALARLRAAAGY